MLSRAASAAADLYMIAGKLARPVSASAASRRTFSFSAGVGISSGLRMSRWKYTSSHVITEVKQSVTYLEMQR